MSAVSNMHLTTALLLLSTVTVHACATAKLPQNHPGSMPSHVRGLAGLITIVSMTVENIFKSFLLIRALLKSTR